MSTLADNATDYIDLSMFDMDTKKKVLSIADAKNKMAEAFLNETGRRQYYYYSYHIKSATDITEPFFYSKIMDLMKQSIYAIRYRLKDTRKIRMKFHNDMSYQMAILYGSLMQLRFKLDNTYATLKHLPYEYKFLHYLVLYERCVVLHVDITQIVERLFKMSDFLRKKIGAETDSEELVELKEKQ